MASDYSIHGRDSEDALEFPDAIPLDVQVIVPRPCENHTEWTSDPYTGIDIPPTFDDLVELPEYQTEPALYAAAIDTIRMTNRCFELTGSYSSSFSKLYPLTEAKVLKKRLDWPQTVDHNGKKMDLSDIEDYPEPPDPRTLFIKENMGDPTNEKLRALWVRACDDVRRMDDLTWRMYLNYTRQQLIDQADAREPREEAWLVLEIFKRYLIWNELCQCYSNRARRFPDRQPTWSELRDYFSRDDVREKGATLAEICHYFPHARDAQMLIFRIEHFATLERYFPRPVAAGGQDPVESRYRSAPPPSRQHIEETILGLLPHGASVSFQDIADQHLSRVHEVVVRTALDALGAQPDLTTGRFILPGNEPSREELEEVLLGQDLYYIVNGFDIQHLAAQFPNRVGDREAFGQTLQGLVFFDETEHRYFPLHRNEETGLKLSHEASLIARDSARIRLSTGLLGNLNWDRTRQQYVPRIHNRHIGDYVGDEEPFVDLGSPTDTVADTEADTVYEGSPPGLVNSMSAMITWEITPISPPAGRLTAPAPPANGPAASPPAPAAEQETRSRRKKRGRIEEAGESSKSKTARKNPKIRCFRRTLKNVRCKKQKDREGEEEWDCGMHKSS